MTAAADGSVEGHDEGDDAVDLLGGILLVRFDVPSGALADGDVVGHPRQHWVPTVGELVFDLTHYA